MKASVTYIIFSTLVILSLAGCIDQDPFGFSTRDIQGAYELKQWEDGATYYLQGPSDKIDQPWGAIEGTVGQLGWTKGFIIVWQNECGSGEGWRIVDTKAKTISPIVSREQIERDPTLSKITIHSVAEAWDKLK